MDEKQRNEIRKRAEAATPGPSWKVEWDWRHVPGMVYEGWATGPTCTGDTFEEMHDAALADAAFVAHAHTDIPALLEALEAAEAERDELLAALADSETMTNYAGQLHYRLWNRYHDLSTLIDACSQTALSHNGRVEWLRRTIAALQEPQPAEPGDAGYLVECKEQIGRQE